MLNICCWGPPRQRTGEKGCVLLCMIHDYVVGGGNGRGKGERGRGVEEGEGGLGRQSL